MILDKYRPNFEALAPEQVEYLARAMRTPVEEPLRGSDLYEIYDEAGYDQADVVMSLATDATLTGVQVVEALIGKPIVRRVEKTKSARAPGAPRRTSSVRKSDPRKIVFVAENPKKAGSASYMRFALYEVGMTVDEFLAKGGTMGDIKWDHERSFIKFEGDE